MSDVGRPRTTRPEKHIRWKTGSSPRVSATAEEEEEDALHNGARAATYNFIRIPNLTDSVLEKFMRCRQPSTRLIDPMFRKATVRFRPTRQRCSPHL